ncbi:MAG: hypothetical protein AAF766_00065 [Cyanobacteria bacterium P01_D01_bin.14]
MKVTITYKAKDRADWRAWLETNYDSATEIWLLYDDRPDCPTVSYLDSVEEAICFGWIDGLQKRINDTEKAQRFTPPPPAQPLDRTQQRTRPSPHPPR